jgi:hypothetical protein
MEKLRTTTSTLRRSQVWADNREPQIVQQGEKSLTTITKES